MRRTSLKHGHLGSTLAILRPSWPEAGLTLAQDRGQRLNKAEFYRNMAPLRRIQSFINNMFVLFYVGVVRAARL
jgi:hypothetical protein